MHTNYRLFVLTESDAVMLILSAGQQAGMAGRAEFATGPIRSNRCKNNGER